MSSGQKSAWEAECDEADQQALKRWKVQDPIVQVRRARAVRDSLRFLKHEDMRLTQRERATIESIERQIQEMLK